MADYVGQITMRSGDQLPTFAVAIEDDMGIPVNISTAQRVDLLLTNHDGEDPRVVPHTPPSPVMSVQAQPIDPVNGVIVYDWTLGDRLRPGMVSIVVVVTLPSGELSAPTDRTARISVRPDAAV